MSLPRFDHHFDGRLELGQPDAGARPIDVGPRFAVDGDGGHSPRRAHGEPGVAVRSALGKLDGAADFAAMAPSFEPDNSQAQKLLADLPVLRERLNRALQDKNISALLHAVEQTRQAALQALDQDQDYDAARQLLLKLLSSLECSYDPQLQEVRSGRSH